jgi:chromosome segregation ATPase
MKSYSDIRLDNERLKLELAHIIQVKDTYEAKFRETNIQLLGFQSEQGRGLESCSEDTDLLRQKLDELTADKASVETEFEQVQGRVNRLEQLLQGKKEAEGRLTEELSKAKERLKETEPFTEDRLSKISPIFPNECR